LNDELPSGIMNEFVVSEHIALIEGTQVLNVDLPRLQLKTQL
jgi:hypothetical protein